MRWESVGLDGPWLLRPEPREDDRGFFARLWCREEAEARGIRVDWVQCNVSHNRRAGTLRGMHWQAEPVPEPKLVRCTAGAIFDALVDVRPESPTYGRWTAVELSAGNRQLLFVPPGFAHGFQTLTDAAEVFYQMGAPYRPELQRGLRWNDPDVDIRWPACAARTIAPRDMAFPLLADAQRAA